MDKGNGFFGADFSDAAGACRIYLAGTISLRLSAVDIGMSSGVDDELRARLANGLRD